MSNFLGQNFLIMSDQNVFQGTKCPITCNLHTNDNNIEHKKANDVNENVVATMSYNEYKDALSNNKCLKHSMNRIQSKDHRIKTMELMKSKKKIIVLF